MLHKSVDLNCDYSVVCIDCRSCCTVGMMTGKLGTFGWVGTRQAAQCTYDRMDIWTSCSSSLKDFPTYSF